MLLPKDNILIEQVNGVYRATQDGHKSTRIHRNQCISILLSGKTCFQDLGEDLKRFIGKRFNC